MTSTTSTAKIDCTEAAKLLGCTRSRVYRAMKKMLLITDPEIRGKISPSAEDYQKLKAKKKTFTITFDPSLLDHVNFDDLRAESEANKQGIHGYKNEDVEKLEAEVTRLHEQIKTKDDQFSKLQNSHDKALDTMKADAILMMGYQKKLGLIPEETPTPENKQDDNENDVAEDAPQDDAKESPESIEGAGESATEEASAQQEPEQESGANEVPTTEVIQTEETNEAATESTDEKVIAETKLGWLMRVMKSPIQIKLGEAQPKPTPEKEPQTDVAA